MRTMRNIWSNHKIMVMAYAALIVSLSLLFLYVHFIRPDFDNTISEVVQSNKDRGFLALMSFISWWGESYIMILSVLCVSLLLFVTSYKKAAIFILSVFIMDIINICLKLIINRPRPEMIDIYPSFQQGSFPSGHVVHYVVFFGFMLCVMLTDARISIILRWAVSLLCVFLIAGVSASRIYLGTHWPTDIIAAYIIGFIMLAVVIQQYLRKRPK
jgi:membrane-associated phospholipid phosphatase